MAAVVEFSVVWCLTARQLRLTFAGRRKQKTDKTWERSNFLTAEVRTFRWWVRKYLTERALNLFMHTLFCRSWLCMPLSLTFTGICLSISGLRNGGCTWITVFLQGLAVYLVAHDKQNVSQWVVRLPERLKIKLKKWLLLWRDGTANQILQVVTTTACKRIYSSLKLPSYLWDHEEYTCIVYYFRYK